MRPLYGDNIDDVQHIKELLAELDASRAMGAETALRLSKSIRQREALSSEGAIMRSLLKAAVCPDSNCDKSGTVCLGGHDHGDGDIEWDIHQCEWCDRRKTAVSGIQND